MKTNMNRKRLIAGILGILLVFGFLSGTGCNINTVTSNNDNENDNTNTITISGIGATAQSSSTILVSWASVSDATSYKVYRSTSADGTYTPVNSTTAASYTDSGLSPSTTYYYKVSAVTAAGESELSNSVSAITSTSGVPSVPSGVAAAPQSSSSILVSWASVPGATGYKVYRSTSESGAYAFIASTTAASYTDSGLSPSTTYYYKVSSVNVEKESELSSSVSATSASSPKVYKVGDTGPAGGIVFYDLGFTMNGWRYLEAAPADIPGVWQWGSNRKGVDGTIAGIGNGKRNTQLIVEFLNQEGEIMKAAQVVEAYEYEGFDDWFLPSKDELDLIYKNLKAKSLGGFQSGSYWTSSDAYSWDQNRSWFQRFSDGGQGIESKDTSLYVRAIRQF
ncbi:MAG: fibronectin type III domain-containing protein [Treponema sp.]|jgi:fibronectin type 3 domain-containing protein|nr:fibronectin type III domain-containing protein [Treponema sp.]